MSIDTGVIAISLAIIVPSIGWAFWISREVSLIGYRLKLLEGRNTKNFDNCSPLRLLSKGKEILETSGLKKYIDDNKEQFVKKINPKKYKSPYEIQTKAMLFFNKYNFGELQYDLINSAYIYGITIEVIEGIAGIYLRDLCLAEAGFSGKDISESMPKTPIKDIKPLGGK